MNMTGVRAICPLTCGCDRPTPKASGFFQTAAWGCPIPCAVIWEAFVSYDCVDMLTDASVVDPNLWARYVYGLKTYILSMDGVSARMYDDLYTYSKWYGIEKNQASVVLEYVTGDDFWGNLSQYQFFLGPNITLFNLSNCNFLSSYHIQSLLTVDLCSTDTTDFLSLRMVCAKTCGCNDLPLNCPPKCSTLPSWYYD